MKKTNLTIFGLTILLAVFMTAFLFIGQSIKGQNAFDGQQNNSNQNSNQNSNRKTNSNTNKKNKGKGNTNMMNSNMMNSNMMNSNTEPNTNGTPE